MVSSSLLRKTLFHNYMDGLVTVQNHNLQYRFLEANKLKVITQFIRFNYVDLNEYMTNIKIFL